jgi:hypothetical protein
MDDLLAAVRLAADRYTEAREETERRRLERIAVFQAAFAAGHSIHAIAQAAGLSDEPVSRALGWPHRQPGRPRAAE